MDDVARKYRELWASLARTRDKDDGNLLIDRIRDALDRQADTLSPADPMFVANSFAIEETVHRGAMHVFRLRHRDLGTIHAMKTVDPQNAEDPILREMLLREARTVFAINHRAVVRGQILLRLPDGRPALVMEWLSGTLAQALEARPFNCIEIASITACILEGIEAVAAAGFVHGDIAPSNIFLTGRDQSSVTIADFGASVEIGNAQAVHDLKLAGRRDYASPEQLAGEPLQPSCDIHAGGALLQRMLDACDDNGPQRDDLLALARDMQASKPDARLDAVKARERISAFPNR